MRSVGPALVLIAAPAFAGELPSGRADELADLVVNDCGSCHGLTLAGGLGPDIRPAALAGASPEAVAAVILDGRPGTAMPPWRPLLSEAEAEWIAAYLLEGAR
jgi:cytochrome c55X